MQGPAADALSVNASTMKWLAVAVLVVTMVIGFVCLGPHRVTPVALSSEVHAAEATAVTTQRQPVGDSARGLAAAREPAPLPCLDAFEEQHREAVQQVLDDERTHGLARLVFGENRTAVVECLVMEVGPVEPRSGTARVSLMSRETNQAKGTKRGDTIEACHNPADEMRTLHVDTGYERLQPGDIRACLLQKQWGKTALRIAGRAIGRLDFDAMRNACDWPTARDYIANVGCSVLEGRLTRTEPGKRAAQWGCKESLLTIERVHWSPVGWQSEEVHRVGHREDVPVDDRDVNEAAEMRTAGDPPQGVTVMLVVMHGWPLDLVLRARVR